MEFERGQGYARARLVVSQVRGRCRRNCAAYVGATSTFEVTFRLLYRIKVSRSVSIRLSLDRRLRVVIRSLRVPKPRVTSDDPRITLDRLSSCPLVASTGIGRDFEIWRYHGTDTRQSAKQIYTYILGAATNWIPPG